MRNFFDKYFESQARWNKLCSAAGLSEDSFSSGGSSSVAGSAVFGAITPAPVALNVSNEGTRDWLILSPTNSAGLEYIPQVWRSKLRGDSLLPSTFRFISTNGNAAGESANSVTPMSVSANAGDEKANDLDNFVGAGGASPTTNSAWWRSMFANAPNINYGFSFSVISDPSAVRTLNLYLGNIINAPAGGTQNIRVTCHMMDNSAADVILDIPFVHPGAAGNQWSKITVAFTSKNTTRMEVTALLTSNAGANGEIAFQALTIS